MCVCVRVRVRARARACVCVCVCAGEHSECLYSLVRSTKTGRVSIAYPILIPGTGCLGLCVNSWSLRAIEFVEEIIQRSSEVRTSPLLLLHKQSVNVQWSQCPCSVCV